MFGLDIFDYLDPEYDPAFDPEVINQGRDEASIDSDVPVYDIDSSYFRLTEQGEYDLDDSIPF